jgi:hypothetical protein
MARSEWAVGYLTKVGLLVLAGQLPAIEQLGRSQLILAYADASDAREVRRRLRRGRRHGRSPVDARSRVPLRHTARLRWPTACGTSPVRCR